MTQFRTLGDLVAWLRDAPIHTQLDAATVADFLDDLVVEELGGGPELTVDPAGEGSWAERLWTAPAERRLGTREVLEALGKGKSWLYSRMSEERGRDRLPHAKMNGELVFTAGEVRAWIRDQEETIAGGRMESTPGERRLHVS